MAPPKMPFGTFSISNMLELLFQSNHPQFSHYLFSDLVNGEEFKRHMTAMKEIPITTELGIFYPLYC